MAAMKTILDFQSEWFKLFLIYPATSYQVSIGISIQVKILKKILKMAAVATILDFHTEQI